MNFRKMFFAWEIMTDMIKIGGITYDVASLIKPYLGFGGEVIGHWINESKCVSPLFFENSTISLSEFFGKELDDFQINICCECGHDHNMVWIHKPGMVREGEIMKQQIIVCEENREVYFDHTS